jgi:hypothetical protein
LDWKRWNKGQKGAQLWQQQRFWGQRLHNLWISEVELPKPIKLTALATRPPLLHQPFGKGVHQFVAIGGPVHPLTLIQLDLPADEPVPKGEAEVDGFGGKCLRALVDLDNDGHQRLEAAIQCRSGRFPFHRVSASMSCAFSFPRVSAIWASSRSYSGNR